VIVLFVVVAALGVVYLAIQGGTTAQAETIPTDTQGGPLPDQISMNNQAEDIDPYDDATWPAGDRIWNICRAIAKAEGYGTRRSDGEPTAPTRNCNPGDISDYASVYGSDPLVTDSRVTKFPDQRTGWNALYQKITNVASGASQVYNRNWSWRSFAAKWQTKPDNTWATHVADYLGVSVDSTVIQYLQGGA
jgi:hypothetical protein